MLEECASLEREDMQRFIQAGMEQDEGVLSDAPAVIRAFFKSLEAPPGWFDPEATRSGIRSFHRNSPLILGAMVGGVLVEGVATNISKSFFLTGRIRDQGVRRLKQNNRHMLEIFLPGGLDRQGDGFKLSVRIRLVHAQVRRLFNLSREWEHDAWGVPVSAAHCGWALSAFSARLLYHAMRLGARFSDEERASFMQVWRYSGYLMGIPDTILLEDEQDALELFRVGLMCEPPPGLESVVMANALVNAAPLVIGQSDPTQRRGLAKYVYQVSGALIGKEMARALRYPRHQTMGVLPLFRMDVRYKRLMGKLFPKRAAAMTSNDFTGLLGASAYDDVGISYATPDKARAEESTFW
ncbi:MAG: oxygenase MpaB family protein [Chloroflexi bacterium]|nr:oxygenase MpaB family protein [Chloroflexota bacterium]